MTHTNQARSGILAKTTLGLGLLALAASSATAVDFGVARVLSAQGQKLKVEIPYASLPGEPVSAVRFSVVAARAADGHFSPTSHQFVIMQPAASNRIILQSAEVVEAGQVDLVLGFGQQPGRQVLYRLTIPGS